MLINQPSSIMESSSEPESTTIIPPILKQAPFVMDYENPFKKRQPPSIGSSLNSDINIITSAKSLLSQVK